MSITSTAKGSFLLAAAAAFLSGALTIALEIILMRLATRYTGSAADGTTAALTIYLLGLLAGSALVLKLNDRGSRGLALPLAMGLSVGLLLLLGWGNSAGGPAHNLHLSGLPLCALMIFPPALGSGTIFPLLLILCSNFYSNNRAILLYLISNLGSAMGAVLSAIWLLPLVGVTGSTTVLAVGWLLVLALIAPILLQVRAEGIKTAAVETGEKIEKIEEIEEIAEVNLDEAVASTIRPYTYICVSVAALAGLIFECIAIRFLTLVCGASFVTTTGAVAATLLAIALGSRFSLNIPQHKNTRLMLAMAGGLAAVGLALTIMLLPHLNNLFQALRHLIYLNNASLADADKHLRWLSYLYPRLALAIIFCLSGATGLALIFPLAVRGASRSGDLLKLYVAAGVGTAAAPLVYLGVLISFQTGGSSMELMLRILTAGVAAMSIVGLAQTLRGKKRGESLFIKMICASSIFLALLVVLLVKPLAPRDIDLGLSFVSPKHTIREIREDDKLSRRPFYREGRCATVSVLVDDRAGTAVLRSDGKVEGTVSIIEGKKRAGNDLPTQSMLGLLPLLYRQQTSTPVSGFLIGYGTGTTATKMLQAVPDLNLHIAEIEPAVLMAGKYFALPNNLPGVHAATTTTGDARQILQGSDTTYDLIVSQPAEPWVQGSTNLYSAEFYRLLHSRLKSGGMYCQWLQLYGLDRTGLVSAMKTITAEFPDCLVYHPSGAGEVLVLAFANVGDRQKIDDLVLSSNFNRANMKAALAEIGIEELAEFKENILLSGADLRKANTLWRISEPEAVTVSDDNLALELNTLPEIENPDRSIGGNLELLRLPSLNYRDK